LNHLPVRFLFLRLQELRYTIPLQGIVTLRYRSLPHTTQKRDVASDDKLVSHKLTKQLVALVSILMLLIPRGHTQ